MYQTGKGTYILFSYSSWNFDKKLNLYPLKYKDGIDSLISQGRRNHLKKIGYLLHLIPSKFQDFILKNYDHVTYRHEIVVPLKKLKKIMTQLCLIKRLYFKVYETKELSIRFSYQHSFPLP